MKHPIRHEIITSRTTHIREDAKPSDNADFPFNIVRRGSIAASDTPTPANQGRCLLNSMTTRAKVIPVSFASEMADVEIIKRKAGDPQQSRVSFSRTKVIALAESQDSACWSDAQLISSVSGDPPNEAALDVLVNRYWDYLFGRCFLLTLDREKASDLAQAAWCRLLRARQRLKPDGNFPAYLTMIATNLFRDSYRAARRAGDIADYRLESLEAALLTDGEESVSLLDIVADLKSLRPDEEALLTLDIDAALAGLTPQLREVLVARFIEGESCAEIGLRHGRTEQTISAWVREGLRQMKTYLEESDFAPVNDEERKPQESRQLVGFSNSVFAAYKRTDGAISLCDKYVKTTENN